jgi:1,4-dihydroxy-2-naphthoyl-CoA hydrolase
MKPRPGRDPAWFNALGRGSLPELMGMTVTAVGEGRLTLELAVRAELMAPNGFLHGGTVVSLADTATGYATVAHLPEGAESFTTLELKMNFLGTARQGIVRAEASAVHLGRTTQVWDAACYAGGSDRAIAHFRCTQMILYPRAGAELSSPVARALAASPAVT